MPGLRLGFAIGQLPKAFHLNLGLQPSTINAAITALDHIDYYQANRIFMLNFIQKISKKNLKEVTFYKSNAPFFMVKINNKQKFSELKFYCEKRSGIVPKYIDKNGDVYIRFGLGPEFICKKIEIYLEALC
jgi:histidinol-phosphate/aromatic aminotransferase/cobyric acid decarboxylase-like protein